MYILKMVKKKNRYIHILKKKYQSIRKKNIIREMYVAKRLMINVKSIGYNCSLSPQNKFIICDAFLSRN